MQKGNEFSQCLSSLCVSVLCIWLKADKLTG